jgi:hypothetical protein
VYFWDLVEVSFPPPHSYQDTSSVLTCHPQA